MKSDGKNAPLKIAFISPEARDEFNRYEEPEPVFGTAPAAVLKGLAGRDDCEIHVISCTKKPLKASPKLASNIFYHPLVVPRWGWTKTFFFGCVRAIRRKVSEINAAIVHGQGTERYAGIGAAFSGRPNVITIHGIMRQIARVKQAPTFSYFGLIARLEAFTIPRSDGIICISSHTKRHVESLARRTWIVPNAVADHYFSVQREPAALPEIICIANIISYKNQLALIRALDPLAPHHFRLIFFGSTFPNDPYCEEVLEMVRARPWCRFEGYKDSIELAKAFRTAALLALPSLEENCPMSVIEAMAAGVPVVASRLGGVPDLIDDGVTGLFCDPQNVETIRSPIERLLQSPELRATMGAAGKIKAMAKFKDTVIAARHMEIYREVVAAKAAAS